MGLLSIEELYEYHIKPLPMKERLRLMEITAQGLASEIPSPPVEESQTLSQFIGAARGSFPTAADADRFLQQERDAWDS